MLLCVRANFEGIDGKCIGRYPGSQI